MSPKAGLVIDIDNTIYEDPHQMLAAWINAFYQAVLAFDHAIDAATCEALTMEAHRLEGNAVPYWARVCHVSEADFNYMVLRFMDHTMIDPCELTQTILAAKQHDYPMVLLTSGVRRWAEPVIRHLGLAAIFPPHKIITIEDTDWVLKAKGPLPYQCAAREMGLEVEDLVMLDDTASNLKVAKALGMTTCWVTHGRDIAHVPDDIDFTLNKVYDVFDLIEKGSIPWQTNKPRFLPRTASSR
jgi:putative hydrolase of the HAD superfamily